MAQKTVQKSVLVKVVERAIAAIYLHRPPTLSHTQRPHSPTVPATPLQIEKFGRKRGWSRLHRTTTSRPPR